MSTAQLLLTVLGFRSAVIRSTSDRNELPSSQGVVAYFRSMKLDAREAELVFNLLDYDNSGEISYQEFVDGCWKLQGEARSLDMKILQLEVETLSKSLRQVTWPAWRRGEIR